MITVSKPFLPPLNEYQQLVADIFKRHWLTNHGPLVIELEDTLKSKLHVPNLQFVTNGTIALQVAIKALELKGEVITTPFSYVATTSSLVWEGCTPVFADIDARTYNIDIKKIESRITENTTAILATHVFGNPCDVEEISQIANKHDLKVIYDGAHAFNVKFKGKSIFEYGDISILSFHATKIFHTIEGGAIMASNKELDEKIFDLKNFGHNGYEAFSGVGINGKNSEFHAAMGLCNLNHIDEILKRYQLNYQLYTEQLISTKSISLQKINPDAEYNFAYFPVLFENEVAMLHVKETLEKKEILTRRYFYPSLHTLDYVEKQNCPVSGSVAQRILCLPMSYYLTETEIDLICNTINQLNY